MTRGGFVCTAEAAGSIVAVGAEFRIVILATEHMLSEAQQEAVRQTPSMSKLQPLLVNCEQLLEAELRRIGLLGELDESGADAYNITYRKDGVL
jgi:hypothetical protein